MAWDFQPVFYLLAYFNRAYDVFYERRDFGSNRIANSLDFLISLSSYREVDRPNSAPSPNNAADKATKRARTLTGIRAKKIKGKEQEHKANCRRRQQDRPMNAALTEISIPSFLQTGFDF